MQPVYGPFRVTKAQSHTVGISEDGILHRPAIDMVIAVQKSKEHAKPTEELRRQVAKTENHHTQLYSGCR